MFFINILEPRTNYNFNGRWLSEFNAVLYNTGDTEEMSLLSSYSHNVKEGKRKIYNNKTVEPKTETLNIFFKSEVDMDDFVNWMDTEEPKPFYYEDSTNRQLMCTLNSDIKLEAYFNSNFNGMVQLELISYDAYWEEKNKRRLEIDKVELDKEYIIYNDGTLKSYPIIKLVKKDTRETSLRFKFNDKEILIEKFGSNIEINAEFGTVTSIDNEVEANRYSSYKCTNGWFEKEMPEMIPLDFNKISILSGDVDSFIVEPNIRWK